MVVYFYNLVDKILLSCGQNKLLLEALEMIRLLIQIISDQTTSIDTKASQYEWNKILWQIC